MGFFAILLALNLLSVRAYAEAEYWFAGIKVVTVIIFVAVGFLMIAGMFGNHSSGFHNWTLSDPKAGTHAPFVGGFTSMLAVFLVAGFSFQGTESVGLAAAETENPGKNVPKAIRTVFWRILLFYIGAIFVAGTLIPYTDPNLLNADESHVSYSPFTMVLQQLPTIGYYAIESHERSHSLFGVVVRKFIDVRGIAHAACNGPRPQSTENLRQAEFARGAGAGALGNRLGQRSGVFLHRDRRQENLSTALQRVEPERIHHLAGHRNLPFAVSQGLGRAGTEPG